MSFLLSQTVRCLHCGADMPRSEPACPHCHKPYLTEAFLPPGTRIGTYIIDYPIGRGGFGATYLAHDPALHRVVAIKEFFPWWATRNPDGHLSVSQTYQLTYQQSLAKFRREGQLLAQIRHANIVQVLGLVEANTTIYLVMEFLQGQTLRQRLRQKPAPWPEPEIKKILTPVAEALSYLHQQNIYHLDLNPSNLLLTTDGRIVLIDFGAARHDAEAAEIGITKTVVCFTPGYAAPEICQGRRARTGPQSDIYSLSAILYELLCGTKPPAPWERDDAWLNPLPPHWHAPLKSGLAQNPHKRPATITDWLALWPQQTPTPHLPLPPAPAAAALTLTIVSIGMGIPLASSLLSPQRQAAAAYHQGRCQNAITLYSQLIAKEPANPTYYHHRAHCYLRLGQLPPALADYQSIFHLEGQLPPQAITALDQIDLDQLHHIANQFPVFQPYYHDRLARQIAAWLASGQLQPALTHLANLAHSLQPQQKTQLAATITQLALSHNDVNTALQLYNAALNLAPNAETYIARAETLLATGKTHQALQDLNTASRLDGFTAKGHYLRGEAMSRVGRWREAAAAYSQAIAGGHELAQSYYARGTAYARLGRLANAIADYDQSLALEPLPERYLARGYAYFRLEKFPAAVADCRKALELQPDQADAHLCLGLAYQRLAQPQLAQTHLRQAAALNPAYQSYLP
ncbi:MAG: protein kinase [Gloeomargarita sp. SKYG98]|nr:protein kinase [Gloeomargarita sp. SKYG98]